MLGIQVERGVHGPLPQRAGLLAMQQVQKMRADGIVIGLHIDALARGAEVVPVQQHRAQRGHQPVGNVAGAGQVVVVLLRQGAAQHRYARAHHIHRVAGRRQLLQRLLDAGGQAAQRLELVLVGPQFCAVRQLAVYQQVGNFLKLADLGHVQNVIAPVAQVIAAAAHSAQRRVARRHASERYRFLGFEGRRRAGRSGLGGRGGHSGISWFKYAQSRETGRPLASTTTISNKPSRTFC